MPTLLLSALLTLFPSLGAAGFRHGGLSFASTEADLLALYPMAEKYQAGEKVGYRCHSARGLFTVDFANGKPHTFMVIDLLPGLDVAGRRKELLRRFGVPTSVDGQSMTWIFEQADRAVYFLVTKQGAYLIVRRL